MNGERVEIKKGDMHCTPNCPHATSQNGNGDKEYPCGQIMSSTNGKGPTNPALQCRTHAKTQAILLGYSQGLVVHANDEIGATVHTNFVPLLTIINGLSFQFVSVEADSQS